jgi:hypothetical protein
LIDAVNKFTGTTDLYTSPIPEPFTYIPAEKPAIAIADGSITSPFLTLFGRSARATGMENERDNNPVSAQWLHMLNSSHIQAKLNQGAALKAIFESGQKPEQIVEELYLTILSRLPTPTEVAHAMEYGKASFAAKPPVAPVAAKGKKSAKGKPAPAAKPPVAPVAAKGKKSAKGKLAPTAKPPKINPVQKHDDWVDIAWSLINSPEFLYRH